jgi:hypothetical protein
MTLRNKVPLLRDSRKQYAISLPLTYPNMCQSEMTRREESCQIF